jgi:peptide chain release factor 1
MAKDAFCASTLLGARSPSLISEFRRWQSASGSAIPTPGGLKGSSPGGVPPNVLASTNDKKIKVSNEFQWLRQCPPLVKVVDELPLIAWEYLFRIHQRALEDEALTSTGKPTGLSISWRRLYSREMDVAERLGKDLKQLQEASGLLDSDDKELKEIALEECVSLSEKLLEEKKDILSIMDLILESVDEISSASSEWIVETIGRAGGEEAAIWARELHTMFSLYANSRGWSVRDYTDNASEVDDGGAAQSQRNALRVKGDGVYTYFRHEVGTHRVQRVPTTEASGRMQTSTASVVLLPIPDPLSVNVRREDCEIEMCRGGGPGGQGVNSASNCARVLHKPTGIRKRCHVSRSGNENVEIALRLIAQDIWKQKLEASKSTSAREFISQLGSGERATKIRTYNFQQNRVTDERVKQNYQCDRFVTDPQQITEIGDILVNLRRTETLYDTLTDIIEKNFPDDR